MCLDRDPLDTELPCDKRAPRTARYLLSDWMCRLHHPDCLDDALLLLSEVVTNAVVHAGPPLEVHFGFATDHDLRIAVHDGTRTLAEPSQPPDEVLEPLPEHGRGLPLVAEMARDWTVTPDDRGKCFAFSVHCGPR